MATTVHNEKDKETLNEIARGHHAVCGLLGFCEEMLRRWHERNRRFLSAWGAVGQAHGKWGHDIGNVTYATAWHHLLQEADTRRWPECRKINGRVSSGNVIEILFGVMYLWERNFESRTHFEVAAKERRFQCYQDVFASTWNLIMDHEEVFQWVTQHRFALETYVMAWHRLLFRAQSQWSTIFVRYKFNGTWNPKEILFAFEVMRMGHAVADLEMFKEHPLPPPLATVSARTWIKYLTHRDVQPIRR